MMTMNNIIGIKELFKSCSESWYAKVSDRMLSRQKVLFSLSFFDAK